jgi:amino acid adenylation domain-containing protein
VKTGPDLHADTPATVLRLFADAVATYADRPAVSDDSGRVLTYAELDAESARLAKRLVAGGVTSEDRVGIHRDRDIDLVVGILGALRAGAAYAAVDMRYPRARRELMLRAAGCRYVVVGDDSLGADFPLLTWHCGTEETEDTDVALPEPERQDAACVLFTSGSTGVPKGVVVEHHNLVHFATNPVLPQLNQDDRVAQVANVSFDTFHYELWSSFAAGAHVVMMPSVPDLVKGDPGRELRRRKITVLLAPTMAFNHIGIEDPDVFGGLRLLLTGGDVIRPAACRSILAGSFDGRMTNLYGPTEGTTAATAEDITEVADDQHSVPIGIGLAGVALLVLDNTFTPVPEGEVGELYLGGTGVTRGYLHDPARTAERFLPDPFGEPGSVMYATGDLVRQRPDGALDYLGRNDDQVKIRGYRVEPSEVDRSLLACRGVLDAAVLPQGGGEDKRLVAFVVLGAETTVPQLREDAEAALPDYQVPAEFVVIPEIPPTAHGKRDTEALLKLLADRDRQRDDYVAPRTDTERYLAGLWEVLLGMERVSRTDDFLALGGNSMLTFRMSRRIARDLAPGMDLEVVLANSMLAELAEAIDTSTVELEVA